MDPGAIARRTGLGKSRGIARGNPFTPTIEAVSSNLEEEKSTPYTLVGLTVQGCSVHAVSADDTSSKAGRRFANGKNPLAAQVRTFLIFTGLTHR